MKRVLNICVLLFCLLTAKAQLYQGLSHYMFNGMTINPAYAGSREMLSTSVLYRNQWAGVEGAPVYQLFSCHAPYADNKMGIGVIVNRESIGVTKATDLAINYAFRFQVHEGLLSLGLKAGINTIYSNWGIIETIEDNDPVFAGASDRVMVPDFGVGAYYYSARWYAGLSIPNLLNYDEKDGGTGHRVYNDFSNYNYLFSSGMILSVDQDFKIKPSFLLKMQNASGVNIDLNSNFIYKEKYWLGFSYRLKESIAVLAEFQVNDQFRFGYAYDIPIGNLKTYNSGSHELMLVYELNYKVKSAHPRYF